VSRAVQTVCSIVSPAARSVHTVHVLWTTWDHVTDRKTQLARPRRSPGQLATCLSSKSSINRGRHREKHSTPPDSPRGRSTRPRRTTVVRKRLFTDRGRTNSTLTLKPSDLWPWPFARVRVMTIALTVLKVKVRGRDYGKCQWGLS